MNAYFTASITGKTQYRKNYQKIIDFLTTKGFTVQSHHIMDTTEDQIRLETKEKRLSFYQQLEKWITNADFLVAEASFPSISVGYEISLALHRGKPVLILYCEGDPPSLLAEHKDERIICEKYSLENLEEMIDYFLYFVKGGADSRFTFFITAQIAAYLDEVAKKAKVPKSVYLRHLIEIDMKDNKYR